MIWQASLDSGSTWTDMPTPSSFKFDWEDIDKNSYRSTITGDLYRHVLSRRWAKIGFTYSYITESDLYTVVTTVNQSGLYIRCKDPVFGSTDNDPTGDEEEKWFVCQGYVSKMSAEMLEGQIGYSLSFNFVQSKKVSGQ